ncbi:hypothetical protein AJ79_00145 [Helicocarpus griseus UAMH5409]|uniref:RalA-binding protein 1 n=1 Tax=Helicocarpus griseus UAMH5409 TaxID=1447875 RepID=A0A2B7YCY8_9EURO|nr:hypothetical protein AJ79_00145 [Helicocarpus griseus UAMH5409]
MLQRRRQQREQGDRDREEDDGYDYGYDYGYDHDYGKMRMKKTKNHHSSSSSDAINIPQHQHQQRPYRHTPHSSISSPIISTSPLLLRGASSSSSSPPAAAAAGLAPFKHSSNNNIINHRNPFNSLMPASLIPRDYLTQPNNHHTNLNNNSSFFNHPNANSNSIANFRPVLPPVHTSSSTTAPTLAHPRSRPQLSSPSPSQPPPGSATTTSTTFRSSSPDQEDSPPSPVSSISPTSTLRAAPSAGSSNASPVSPISPVSPFSPIPSSTSTQVSAFPIPPTTTVTDRSLNLPPEALKYPPVPPDRPGGSSQLRGANGNMQKSSSYDQLRKASDPPRPLAMNNTNNNNNNNNHDKINNAGGSRVTSPSNPALSSVGERIRGTVPRTSSIDSAISSISSAHSHKSSVDAINVSPDDVARLIATAGSAENLIIHILRENEQRRAQNKKLWELVNKQREMLFGLNHDLERAIKDKDTYKKKLKEPQSNPPPLPVATTQATGELAAVAAAAAAAEADGNSPMDSTSGHDRANLLSEGAVRSSPDNSTMFPSPLHVDHSHTDHLPARRETPGSDPSTPCDAPRTEQPGPTQQSRDSPTDPSIHEIHRRQAQASGSGSNSSGTARKAGSSNNTLPASLRAGGPGNQKPVPPPIRRPPPAPLNLSQAERMTIQSQQANVAIEDNSDYDDALEVDEISKLIEKRGRRKTREEDDREREALLLQEKAARSASNKKKSKSVQPPEGLHKPQSQGFAGMSAPTGNRMVAHSPPAGLAKQISPPESLASMLSPPMSEGGSSEKDRLVVSPPMSPGLPLSPRPGDRPMNAPTPRFPKEGHGTLASPPMSPRGLPLSPRAPKFPTPPFSEPATENSSLAKPAEVRNTSPVQTEVDKVEIPTFDASVKIDSPTSPEEPRSRIYRGLVSDQYPNLLLPPNALPSIDIKVSSSRLRPSRNSYLALKPTEEEPVFTLSVFSRANRAELWRVEKVIMALPQLDGQLKMVSDFSGRLPDRSIFTGHSPAKVDARRAVLNSYFESILDTPLEEAGALVVCQFLTADAIEPRDDETSLVNGESKGKHSYPLGPDGKPRIEGYLTKRGKNFGGWKARYFVLHGPELKYYESPGGPHMGTIKIHHAQIGKQSTSSNTNQSPSRGIEDDTDNQYRHAFLILEPKKKDSTALVRHVLCAESDEERDSWVEALLSYVENASEEDENAKAERYQRHQNDHMQSRDQNRDEIRTQNRDHNRDHKLNPSPNHNYNHQTSKLDAPPKSRKHCPSSRKGGGGTEGPEAPETTEVLRSFSYDDVVAAEAPIRGPPGSKIPPTKPANLEQGLQPPSDQPVPLSPSVKSISAPTNGVKIQDAGAWGNKIAPPMSNKEKKRSIWGFRAAATADLANQIQNHEANNPPTERKDAVKPVFGLPLAEAVEFCGVPGIDSGLPAVVYRCIEYLRAKEAALEEGIFRLSGSNVVIKSLKEKFNTEGDLNFLEGDTYYDVHAVASLFKQYLRELPATVLTRELHLDFIRVLELDEKQKKIAAFNGLVHRLPKANLTLLKALSQYLIDIVENSDVNKMTVRNVGIVFAPTLNIPAPVFSMFLTDFESIFGQPVKDFSIHPAELIADKSPSPEDIRSPRHQMFSDLPTPSYAQSSFPPSHHRSEMMPEGAQRERDPREKYDTGFIPIHPTYEQHVLGSDPSHRHQSHAQGRADEYNSMSNLLAPGMNNMQQPMSKSKRRESNLLFMNIGNRKSGMPNLPKPRDERCMF